MVIGSLHSHKLHIHWLHVGIPAFRAQHAKAGVSLATYLASLVFCVLFVTFALLAPAGTTVVGCRQPILLWFVTDYIHEHKGCAL